MLADLQSYNQLRNQIQELFPELIDLTESANLPQKTELLRQWQQKAKDDTFLIMVVGDFSRGKSTLINALLGKDLLPTRMTPCTGAITVVQHGDPPKAIKTYWENNNRPPEEISYEKFREEASLSGQKLTANAEKQNEVSETEALETAVNPQLAQSPIRQLDLYYPAELCRNRVQIVDSPGLNEDRHQTEVTLDFLPKADAVVVVMTAERALAENEVKFIRDLLTMGFRHLFFAINFRDAFEDAEEDELEEMEEDIRQKLRTLIGDKPLRMATISSRLALEGRMAGDTEKIRESHIEDLENPLGHFLTHDRGRAFLEGLIDQMRTNRNEIELVLRQRMDLREKSLAELERRQESIETKFKELQDRKQKIIETVKIHAGKARRRQLADFRERMSRLSDDELSWAANSWICNQNVLITPGQFKKCTEYYVHKADTFIQEKIAEWANKEVVPTLQQEVERLCEAIGDDARAILKKLDEMRMEINADTQLNSLSGEKPAAIVERLMVAGIAIVSGFPIVAIMGGLFGARQAAEQFAMQIGAGVLMAVLGVLNLPLFLVAGGMIAIINGFRNAQSSKEAIRDRVIKEIQMRIRQPTGEMEERLADTIKHVFESFSESLSSGIDNHVAEIQQEIEIVINEKRQMESEASDCIESEKQLLGRTATIGKVIEGLATDLIKLPGSKGL